LSTKPALKKCPFCAAWVADALDKCSYCRLDLPMPRTCPFCRQRVSVTAKVCPFCAEDISAGVTDPAADKAESHEAEPSHPPHSERNGAKPVLTPKSILGALFSITALWLLTLAMTYSSGCDGGKSADVIRAPNSGTSSNPAAVTRPTSSPPSTSISIPPSNPRLSKGQIAKLAAGSKETVNVGRTLEDFSQWTKCYDRVDGVLDCAFNLVHDKRILLLPKGTTVKVMDVRTNPLNPSALIGHVVQAQVLSGTSRGQAVWTLESNLNVEPTASDELADLRRRQEIFARLSAGEAKAMATADRRYPEPPLGTPYSEAYAKRANAHDTLFSKLLDESDDNIQSKYGLSREQLVRIKIEGNKAGWPKQ
jgi:hypothetical protein